MKKKLLALLSVVMLVFVGFNNAACSDDDDNDNDGSVFSMDTTDVKTALEQGTNDGKAYAEAYAVVKENGVASPEGITNITKMVTYAKKYKKNQSKTYKAAFLTSANGIGDETQVENLLENSTTFGALKTLLATIFSDDETED